MKLTVVITCYESIATIGSTIISVASQTRRPDEIIVTDDGSNNDTCSYVKQILKFVTESYGIPTHFASHSRTTPYRLNTIRNTGISSATGDIIFLFDGDIFVPRKFLESHERIHQQLKKEAKRAFISCVRRNFRGDGTVTEGRISEWGHQLDRFLLSNRWQDLNLDPEHTLSQASFLRSDWERVGGFDTDYDGYWGFDEIDFAYKLKSLGTILTCSGTVFHLEENAALGNRDDSRNRALYQRKKEEWLEKRKLHT